MKSQRTKIYRGDIDIATAAQGMCVAPEQYLLSLRDGRAISRWSEIWVAAIYKLKLTKPNTKNSDSVGSLDSEYSTKTLTDGGTAVRRSSNTGVGRTCTSEDTMSAIRAVVAFNFVDNTQLPMISFIQVPSGVVMEWFKDGHIGKTGHISYAKFYQVLGETEIIRVSLLTGDRL